MQDEDTGKSLPELLQSTRGIGTVIAECIALFGMAPFLWIEACTLKEYGIAGWASVWNVMDVVMYINQVYPPPLHADSCLGCPQYPRRSGLIQLLHPPPPPPPPPPHKEYGIAGWASVWNVMDVIMYMNQVYAPRFSLTLARVAHNVLVVQA